MPGDRPLRIRDLLDADEESVQWAAREITHEDLVAVLSVESDEVVEWLCNATGRRRAMRLREDIAFADSCAALAIPDAERRVDAVLRRLVQDGRLTLLPPPPDDEVVLSEAEIDDLLDGLDDDPLR